ncbi:hypothetical protein ACFOU0_00845 [Salinicoccus sesuvii]|uniref:Uncharacterized protein n=1 Tax=Salinicoccus sesuvii TaxID=868281 RepID=A0ABV7N1L5_9STAP
MDVFIILLMLVTFVLFIYSRRMLVQTRIRIDDRNRMKEMHYGILKYIEEGKSKEEIIILLMKDYGLERPEADYMYSRVVIGSQ